MGTTRFKGATAAERLSLGTLSDSDMFQTRHLPGTVSDSDKGVSKSILQSIPFGICTTAASTNVKVAALSGSCPDFTLVSGREIVVYFSEANIAANPALNFEGTGAVPIYSPKGFPVGTWSAGVWLQLKYFEVEIGGTVLTRWLAMSPVATDGEVGDIKAVSYIDIPDGWLECNGQAVSRSTYAVLFNKYNTQKYDGTNTLLSLYGTGNGSTTFNLPDYREVALVGAGHNSKDSIASHDVYTVGQFKDDRVQAHIHSVRTLGYNWGYGTSRRIPTLGEGNYDLTPPSASTPPILTTVDQNGRSGETTRVKSKGVKYIVKVL